MEQKNINNNLLQIWFNSYKRYKYWLGIYYLIFLIFFVILTNIKDWSIIFEFKDIRNKVSLIEYMEEKIDTSLFEKDINILHIPAKFARYKTPYDFNKNQEGKYFKERRKIITAFSNIIPDIDTNKYFLSDSLVILEVMEKYRSYKDSMKIIKPQKKGFPNLRKQFEKEIADTLLKINQYYLTKHFKKYYKFKNLTIDDFEHTYKSFKDKYINNLKRINELAKLRLISIPYTDQSLDLDIGFFISLPLFLILSFYIPLLYINLFNYTKVIEKNNKSLIKLPTLINILKSINIYNKFMYIIFKILNIIIIFVVPFCTTLFMIIIMMQLTNIAILILGLYLFFYLLFIIKIIKYFKINGLTNIKNLKEKIIRMFTKKTNR